MIARSHSPQANGEAATSTSSSGAGARGPAPEHRAGDSRRIVDEDDVFHVPELLAGMAEGLMMSPPGLVGTLSPEEDGSEDGVVSLWDHS